MIMEMGYVCCGDGNGQSRCLLILPEALNVSTRETEEQVHKS